MGNVGLRIEGIWGSRLKNGCLNELQCIELCNLLWTWPDSEILWCLDDMAKRLEYSPVQRDWHETHASIPVHLRSSRGAPLHQAGEALDDPDVVLKAESDRVKRERMDEVERIRPGWYRYALCKHLPKHLKKGLPFWQVVRLLIDEAKGLGLPAWELERLDKIMKDSQTRHLERMSA